MPPRRHALLGWIGAGLVLAGVAAGIGWQRWQAALLRLELDPLREEARELATLRGENDRLRRGQPSAAEIARLRADHESIVRLRTELDALRARLPPAK